MLSTRKGFLFILILGLLLVACSRSGSAEYAVEMPMSSVQQAPSLVAEDSFYSGGEAGFGAANDGGAGQQTQTTQARLIIRTADLNVVVANTETAVAAISQMVEANGGWVVSANLYQYGENAKSGNITVRVPVTGFNSAISAVKDLAVRVTSESSSGQDVTEEYVDLSARLGNLEATADRVRAFLDETANVEEALQVNQELSRLEGEIEAMKGRMQYLSQSAGFSTISVNLTPDIALQPLAPQTWQPSVVARQSFEALVNTLQDVVNFLIAAVIYLLPLALLFGVPLWLIIRYVVRRRRQQHASSS